MSLRDRLNKAGGRVSSVRGPSTSATPKQSSSSASGTTSEGTSTSVSTSSQSPVSSTAPLNTGASNLNKGERFEEVKSRVHSLLVQNMNLGASSELTTDETRIAAQRFLEQFLIAEKIPMAHAEREALIQELVEEIIGLGPLEPLLREATISEIMVNGPIRFILNETVSWNAPL